MALHGCSQTLDDVGLDFVTRTGLNGYAEANNITVLYPQVQASAFGPVNPLGCFDWTGYTNEAYASKNGVQVQCIKRLVDKALEGEYAQ